MAEAVDIVEIWDSPLDVVKAVALAGDGGSGAITIFLGTTRGERRADGCELSALEYEAYREMAVAQIRRLCGEARGKWPIGRSVVLHRVGRVDVGQPSVLIAVSTPHRKEGFAACEYLIDRLKADVAIWKKEVWEDGSVSWVKGEIGEPFDDAHGEQARRLHGENGGD